MSEENGSQNERRDQSFIISKKMLEERGEMMSLLKDISNLAPYEDVVPVAPVLEQFCELLIDYIASAHFGLYERIAEGKERRQRVIDAAESTYPHIDDSTQVAIEFNERYEAPEDKTIQEHLEADIQALNELLAIRIEYEDQLLNAMLGEGSPA